MHSTSPSMEKSYTSSQNRKLSIARQARLIPLTPHSEIMTPLTTHAMVSPASRTSQPMETSMSSIYLRIIGDVMGKFIPRDKMSEVFHNLAGRFKEEESRVTLVPVGTPIRQRVQTEPAAQTLKSETTKTANNLEQEAEIEEGVDGGKEREIRKPVGEELAGRALEVVNVEEIESDDDRETLSERTRRWSFCTQHGLDRGELRSMREEAVVLAASKREAAKRKRKRKLVATPS